MPADLLRSFSIISLKKKNMKENEKVECQIYEVFFGAAVKKKICIKCLMHPFFFITRIILLLLHIYYCHYYCINSNIVFFVAPIS